MEYWPETGHSAGWASRAQRPAGGHMVYVRCHRSDGVVHATFEFAIYDGARIIRERREDANLESDATAADSRAPHQKLDSPLAPLRRYSLILRNGAVARSRRSWWKHACRARERDLER